MSLKSVVAKLEKVEAEFNQKRAARKRRTRTQSELAEWEKIARAKQDIEYQKLKLERQKLEEQARNLKRTSVAKTKEARAAKAIGKGAAKAGKKIGRFVFGKSKR